MYPHERSLVKKMEGKPLTLLGVNTDAPERLKAVIEREQMTWPNFSAGSTDGAIPRRWNVVTSPMIYILDAKGVIRYRQVPGEAMDAAVEKLLAEMGQGPATAPAR